MSSLGCNLKGTFYIFARKQVLLHFWPAKFPRSDSRFMNIHECGNGLHDSGLHFTR